MMLGFQPRIKRVVEREVHGDWRVRRALIQANLMIGARMAPNNSVHQPLKAGVVDMLTVAAHHQVNWSGRKTVPDIVCDQDERHSMAALPIHLNPDVPNIMTATRKLPFPVVAERKLQALCDNPVDDAIEL